MQLITHLKRAVLALTLLGAAFVGTGPAMAAMPSGSAAWTNKPLFVMEGPGGEYRQVGQVDGRIAIRVERCSKQWCKIRYDGPSGWVPILHLNFGQLPGYMFEHRAPGYPGGPPGQACFYAGANFSGNVFCAKTGEVVDDLLLYGLDNAVSSIALEGNASVTVCRDRHFTSYCTRIVKSEPGLNRYLANSISSYRVH